MLRDRTAIGLTVGLAACLLAGTVLPGWLVDQMLFGFARALPVLGLLLLWRSGFISFGHALYLGLGAYTVALLDIHFGITDAALRLVAAILVAGAAGWLLGFILRRHRAIFFAMLNLAFSMVLYGILVKTEALGSTDGFSVSPATFFGLEVEGRYAVFAAVCLVGWLAALGLHWYLGTTLGWLTTAIRDNEMRVEALGYSVERAIHVNYAISAALTGAGGAFMAMGLGQVDPDSMVNWTASGELVFITIFSGAGSVAAPFIGSFVFEILRTYAFEWLPQAWQLMVGGTLLLVIFFLPGGIWSVFRRPRRPAR